MDTIVEVDPKTLLVGPNVRKEVNLTERFLSSIRENGVEVPIIAQQTPDGLDVLDGQRRTLAAVDVGLALVPVVVRAENVADGDRAVGQLIANLERAGLTKQEEVAAYKQLALDFKVPAAEIVRKLGVKAENVKAAVAVASSPAATAALESPKIDLALAAKIAEAKLTKAEAKTVVDHHYNPEGALRDVIEKREAAAATKKIEKELADAGVPIAAQPNRDSYRGETNKHLFVRDLVDKVTGEQVLVGPHASCPGHAAWVGKRGYRDGIEAHYLCTDPSKYGHRDVYRAAPKPPLTDEERAAKKVVADRDAAWPIACETRLAFVKELLTRKTVPSASQLVVADFLNAHVGGGYGWHAAACTLLGLTPDQWKITEALQEYADAHPTGAARAELAMVIARHEIELDRKGGWQSISLTYLRLLVTAGYTPTEIEQQLLDDTAKTEK